MKRFKKTLAAIMLITVAFSIIGCNDNSKNNPEFVDLGLPSGTLWATFNVGADKPEEYGDYFAWGEIEPKKTYNSSTYEYCECEGRRIHLTKYCVDPDFQSTKGWYGTTDNLTIMETIDDAATTNWGSDWCIPTEEQWRELLDNTTYKWTTQKGVNGRLLTSKKNGQTIFLPAAGYRADGKREGHGHRGSYWSSSLNTCDPKVAWNFWFESSGGYDVSPRNRFSGISIRPVRFGCNGHAYVDLGLPSGTLWATCNVGAATPETYGNYYSWEDVTATNWGSDWRMPTKAQWDELKGNTTNEWTSQKCVSGMLFTAKNGQTLFLPAAGYINNKYIYENTGSCGHYWSNSLETGKPSDALYIYFRSDFYKMLHDEQSYKLSVRAVRTNVATENANSSTSSTFAQIQRIYSNAYDGFVNIRQEPQSKAPILGVLRNGPEGAILLGTEGEWKKIDCNGIVGYVYEKYVQDTPTEVYEYWGMLRKDASNYRFTENDLSPLTAKELTYLCSSVYAKHGYVFNSQELNNYFKRISWYHPDASVTEAVLNSVERANVEFIKNYQERNGKTYESQ